MNPNKKPLKARVYRNFAGRWVLACHQCGAPFKNFVLTDYANHSSAIKYAHLHMTGEHAPARPVTRLRQTRRNNWRAQ